MNQTIDKKRILIFLILAFGIAWAGGLVVFITGGMADSPVIAGNLTLATVLIAVVYMWAPALANILTRVTTHEGWKNNWLKPNFKKGWLLWLAAWVLPGVLTILGAAQFFALFPQYFDSNLTTVKQILDSAGWTERGLTPWMLIGIQVVQGILISPLVNGFFTFGEEFGWRGYLLQKLMPLGSRKAVLLSGVIWGVWHWPVIAMGHNYGLDYTGAPWLGMLMMVWFTIVMGVFLSWVTLRGGSVWPAVIGHAAINGIAGLGSLFVKSTPNPLIGPLPVGIIGSIGFALAAGWILASKNGLKSVVEIPPVEPISSENVQ